jgi:hypothetical protein
VWRGGEWINERPIARSRMRAVLRGLRPPLARTHIASFTS